MLALFGELDNNIMAEKNRAAWETALRAGNHPDYTLRILPKANHALLEAKVGNNAEMKSLRRFVPAYSEVVLDWLTKHIAGFGVAKKAASRSGADATVTSYSLRSASIGLMLAARRAGSTVATTAATSSVAIATP